MRTVAFIAAAALLAAGCRSPHGSILLVLHEQQRLHPAMQVEDVYKLVHQASFGNEHVIPDEGMARKYLLSELESVKADDAEPLIERINIGPGEIGQVAGNVSLVRINLRPFKAGHLDPERLVDAMLASARAFHPDPNMFERSWQEVVQSAASGSLPWTADALRAFGAARKAAGYPAIHHSDVYNTNYHPAYRVVTTAEAAKACRVE